ncbi:MAG TPA: hypothetical protein VKT77_20355 [Chthonomonadaceae bacterium]|nr:hypothetical protein [Chthonomonadaceae bacterium]
MPTVIRAVRLPEVAGPAEFELSLPKGADIIKAGGVFAGLVDAEGNPVPAHALFLLTQAGPVETEVRRFVAVELASGLDDLSSPVPELPGSLYRYIADMPNGLLLLEALDAPPAEPPSAIADVNVVHI